MLNESRVREVHAFLTYARKLRTGEIPLVKWRAKAAAALALAGQERRSASLPWDYTVPLWVCRCCVLAAANGECCDSDEHGGDSMVPLSSIKATDSAMLGGEHNPERCYLDGGCDCVFHEFETSQCPGCGSFLAGSRYAMTLFVNDRRNVPVVA